MSLAVTNEQPSLAGMIWNPLLDICVVSSVSGWMVAAAATPLAFELVMLVSVCVNSVDRPRAATVPLRRSLVSDGIVFFVVREARPLLLLGH
jgi:phosphatidylglycerophosphate synthase